MPLAYIRALHEPSVSLPDHADFYVDPDKLISVNLVCKDLDQLKKYKSIDLRYHKDSKLSLYRFDIKENLEEAEQWFQATRLMPGIYYIHATGENESNEQFLGPLAILEEPNKTYEIVFPAMQ